MQAVMSVTYMCVMYMTEQVVTESQPVVPVLKQHNNLSRVTKQLRAPALPAWRPLQRITCKEDIGKVWRYD